MARPLWSGTIQISLVGFAVEVYPATSTTPPYLLPRNRQKHSGPDTPAERVGGTGAGGRIC